MRTWPHAPSKAVTHPGMYIITASTLHKRHLFDTPEKRDLLLGTIFELADLLGWELQAWAVLSNHYHLVGHSPPIENSVKELTTRIHGQSARELNRLDDAVGRNVWYRSWDTRLTFEKSYLARLAYVHTNPVKHGAALDAHAYPWCSARWFFETADRPFYETVMSFKTDQLNVYDAFD